ncbi:MAG: hypothetical protein WCE21_02045 [Candidatus Babeliales bacterium]
MIRYLLFCVLCITSVASAQEYKPKHYGKANQTAAKKQSIPPCANEATCKDLGASCQCYCARVCGFRNKKLSGPDKDNPIYVPNDPNGKYCYCKQWDLDNYNSRHCTEIEQAKARDKALGLKGNNEY